MKWRFLPNGKGRRFACSWSARSPQKYMWTDSSWAAATTSQHLRCSTSRQPSSQAATPSPSWSITAAASLSSSTPTAMPIRRTRRLTGTASSEKSVYSIHNHQTSIINLLSYSLPSSTISTSKVGISMPMGIRFSCAVSTMHASGH